MAEAKAAETDSAEVTSHMWVLITRSGKSLCRALIVEADDARVAERSNKATPDAPCSSRARAEARASVPAPPVSMQCPEMVKRANARVGGSVEAIEGRGAVRGLLAVERAIRGIWREVKAARSSTVELEEAMVFGGGLLLSPIAFKRAVPGSGRKQ